MEDEKIRTLCNIISRIGQLLNTIYPNQINTWLVDAARESLTTSKQLLEKPTAHLAGLYLSTSMEPDVHYCIHKLQMDVSWAKLI
jgi:hypothetical protein